MNKFTHIKELFANDEGYINLSSSAIAYKKLSSAIKAPIKLAAIYGKAGSGKSFLLRKIYDENGLDVVYFAQPFFSETDFYRELYRAMLGGEKNFKGYEDFLRAYEAELKGKKTVAIMLDEASFYPQDLLNKIRLLSDTMLFKFIFAAHKSDEESIFFKDYFKTRIWEFVELKSLESDNVALYIEKKMGEKNYRERCAKFKDEHFELITRLSEGNLRTINKLMYKFFEIYEYYEQNAPEKISGEFMNERVILMAAIACGVIDA